MSNIANKDSEMAPGDLVWEHTLKIVYILSAELHQTVICGGKWKREIKSPEPLKKYDHFKDNPGEPSRNFKGKFRAITRKTLTAPKKGSVVNFFRSANADKPRAEAEKPVEFTVGTMEEQIEEFTRNVLGENDTPPSKLVDPPVGQVLLGEAVLEDVAPLTGANPDGKDSEKDPGDGSMAAALLQAIGPDPTQNKKPKTRSKTTSCLPTRMSSRLRNKGGKSWSICMVQPCFCERLRKYTLFQALKTLPPSLRRLLLQVD